MCTDFNNFGHKFSQHRFRKFLISHYCTSVSDNITVPFASKYDSKAVESGKYDKWVTKGYFHPKYGSNNDVFSIILPPPNITGTLHLGHALTVTIQDILCRWKRMQGCTVMWVPGTDHAGIATQVIVEKNLRGTTGQTRKDIGREKFLDIISKWKDEKMEKINSQLRQLGASVDWSRYVFTMDSKQSEVVTEAIIRMFDDNLFYRENMLVNWSCYLQSTISDYEVDYTVVNGPTKIPVPGYDSPVEFGTIADFSYQVVDSEEELVVSSTRPETVFGDVAIAVHPNDQRYSHLKGALLMHPLIESTIPVIVDESVDITCGTGVMKVTPGHSKIDYEIGKRHNLPVISILTESGFMNENCRDFSYLPRFIAKEKVLTKLYELGRLKEIRGHEMKLPVCSRSGDIIEQLLKPQWFIKCKNLAERAIQAVENGDLIVEPRKHIDTYYKWLQNSQDWCVSRQLWWGHQLPLYKTELGWIAAKSVNEAKVKAREKFICECENVEQDADVLDTWFSSALLPFSVFGWPNVDNDYRLFYPLSLVETGADIFNFWVIRMVMLGLYFTNNVPFKKVLLHGMITDSRGRKMSKSLGNVIEFDNVINGITLKELHNTVKANHVAGLLSDIEMKYALAFQKELFPQGLSPCGADALRLTLASLESKEAVIHFNPDRCRDNTKFCNKMWQAAKFIIGWSIHLHIHVESSFQPLFPWHHWLLHRLWYTVNAVNEALENTDFHVASHKMKIFFHHDMCDVYLELAKPVLKTGVETEAKATCFVMLYCLETYLRLITPVMPFITDELYSFLPRSNMKPVWETTYPRPEEYNLWKNDSLNCEMLLVRETVTNARALIQILRCPKAETEVVIVSENNDFLKKYANIIHTLIRCKSVKVESTLPTNLLGPVTVVEDKTSVHLILSSLSEKQIATNFKLLKSQIDRSQFITKERLKNFKPSAELNKQLQDLIEEWKQSEVELTQFYDFKSQTIPTVNDLKQMMIFAFKAHRLVARIKTEMKTVRS